MEININYNTFTKLTNNIIKLKEREREVLLSELISCKEDMTIKLFRSPDEAVEEIRKVVTEDVYRNMHKLKPNQNAEEAIESGLASFKKTLTNKNSSVTKYFIRVLEDTVVWESLDKDFDKDYSYRVTIDKKTRDIDFEATDAVTESTLTTLNITKNEFIACCLNELLTSGKILYDMNHKLVEEKIEIEKVIKKKKIKSKTSRKKTVKEVVVNRKMIIYTGIPTKLAKELNPRNYYMLSWSCRGYWRTNGYTKKREWIQPTVKARKCKEVSDKQEDDKIYVYK